MKHAACKNTATSDKSKGDACDEEQCSNSLSSSENGIHTLWTDESKNFGLRVKIEDCKLATSSANYRANTHGLVQAASHDMHIKGVSTLHFIVQFTEKHSKNEKRMLRYPFDAYVAFFQPKQSNAPYTASL